MTAVSLFDALAGPGTEITSPDQERIAQLARLAEKLVASALVDWQRVVEYEQQFGSSSFATPALEDQVNRSIYEIYQKWAADAEAVLERTQHLKACGHRVSNARELEDAFGRVSARLKLTPEMIAHATEQVRQGHIIPLEELRNELRARLRA
jgi:hypothetical protein